MVRSTEGKHPEYFEAILQLRDVSKEVISFTEKEIIRNKIPLAKKKKVKNGWDYYLADNNYTKSLGKKLQERFGGKHLVTSSLFGKKKGKDIYRITVLFKGIPFKKGEKVEYHGEEYNVKILGKDILLQNSKTGKKAHVKYKDVEQVKKL